MSTSRACRATCALLMLLCVLNAARAGDLALDDATRVIEQAIPPGWSIVERKSGEIPWGHHWCDKYDGVTGALLILRGVNPSKSPFLGPDGQWRDVVVGAEALEVWVMPGSYRESRLDALCFHRPIQPTPVLEMKDVRIYARPSSYSNVVEKARFDKELADSKAVESPESPWNDPARLSWRSWRNDIHAAFATQRKP